MAAFDVVDIRVCDIPSYLQDGAYYESLNKENVYEVISVPSNTVKLDCEVTSAAELSHLLQSLQFWIVSTVPVTAIKFVLMHPETTLQVCRDFERNFPQIRNMLRINSEVSLDIRLRKAASLGELVAVKFFIESGAPVYSMVAELAARSGQAHVLQYLHEKGCPMDETVTAEAARQGHLSCLQYLHDHCSMAMTNHTVRNAALSGKAACLLYALSCLSAQAEQRMRADLVIWAAEGRSVECLRLLQQRGTFLAVPAALSVAAEAGSYDCIVLLHEGGCPLDNADLCALVLSCALWCGYKERLRCLKYLREHGCPWDDRVMQCAAKLGLLEALQYAHQHGCPVPENACRSAAEFRQLECLRYLLENAFVPTIDAAVGAACKGHLDCLQLLRQHGCPWDGSVTAAAAGAGKLACLQYLHEAGCPWDSRTLNYTDQFRNEACQRYAEKHGCPSSHTEEWIRDWCTLS